MSHEQDILGLHFEAHMHNILANHPFYLDSVRRIEVEKVFKLGEMNRDTIPSMPTGCGAERFHEHLNHANNHFEAGAVGMPEELESGLSHYSHAMARLMLAMASVASAWRDSIQCHADDEELGY